MKRVCAGYARLHQHFGDATRGLLKNLSMSELTKELTPLDAY
jgi:hypothetical protein